ncbi:MAG: hypothetical protein N2D54_11855, partial [Chloroflexota bacterium]
MRIITNETIIKKNSRIGFWASLISPVLFAASASVYFSARANISASIGLVILGFLFFQGGIALRKWSQGADESLNRVLKKLSNDYTLYHFQTPVSHLLVGPAG